MDNIRIQQDNSFDEFLKACEYGNLEMVEFFIAQCGPETEKYSHYGITRAAGRGQLQVIQCMIYKHNCNKVDILQSTMNIAAANGQLNILIWFHENMPEISYDNVAFDNAAKGRHYNVLEWLTANRHDARPRFAMDWVAETGDIEMLNWLHRNRPDVLCTENAIKFAIHAGHLDVVIWLYTNRPEICTLTNNAMSWAANDGRFDILVWLHKNRPELKCYPATLVWAATKGHLDIVIWLSENRPDAAVDSINLQRAITGATENGHLEVVNWLRANLYDKIYNIQ